MIKLHHLKGYIQTILLAEYQDKLLLLDGCSRADVSLIKDFITQKLNKPFESLHTVIVTHMHPDHAGAAHKLRKLTSCKVVSANVEGQWYQGLDGILMHLTDMLLAKWVAKRMKKPISYLWYSRKLKADILLKDNEEVPGFEDWRVIFTQGHTDRDISILHTPSQKIYVADLMVKVKGKYIPPFPVFYPNRYKASLKKIKNMKASSLILAHGGEIQLTDDDYSHLLNQAPTKPMTHWRSVKSKLKTVLTK